MRRVALATLLAVLNFGAGPTTSVTIRPDRDCTLCGQCECWSNIPNGNCGRCKGAKLDLPPLPQAPSPRPVPSK